VSVIADKNFIDEPTAIGQDPRMRRQGDEPNIDPRWDDTMELLLDGRSHKTVAAVVGCHRNTITNWLKDPTFRVKLARRSDERLAAAKQRLAIVTTKLVDRLGQLAQQAMDAAEHDPTDRHAQRAARDWLRNYRELCRVEAQILGPVASSAGAFRPAWARPQRMRVRNGPMKRCSGDQSRIEKHTRVNVPA
jgi:hypothetical protein